MLLDSGCTQSVFPRSQFQQLSRHSHSMLHPVVGHGILADGTKIILDGLSVVKFQIGRLKFEHKFLIADIANDILLGLDFFEAQNCVIDFHKSQLQIQGQVIDCCDDKGHPYQVTVQVQYELVIPAQSEKLDVGRLSQDLPISSLVCVESADKVPGILVATTAQIPAKQKVQIRLLNYTDKDVVIPAGKVIATCMVANVCESERESEEDATELPAHLRPMVEGSYDKFTTSEVEKVKILLTKYQAVFSKEKYDLGQTSLVQHTIPLVPGATPLKQRPYRHGPTQEAEVEKQVKELQAQGLIKEGHGAWSSPVVLVQKKDGSWRFCVDYRKLNEVTHKDAYPLPRIDDSLDALGGSKLFSTLDLTSGYWQVELDKEAKERAAFVTRSGLWEWQVLPFGLTSAPSTFERLMETVLRGLHWKTLLIYLDDIIVFSQDLDSHLERLEEVFVRLQKAGLKLKPEKCKLFADKVKYLGHVVSSAGVETDDAKLLAVKEWPTPRHKKDVRAFLGTCGYYRKFIHHYAEVSRPLSQLSSKHAKFHWTPECQKAFDELKEKLTTAPILAYPDHALQFILDTDASQVGTGAVLSQVQDGQERVVAYYSKMYSKEEANYCVTRQEFLAIIKAVKHFRPHLYGREFVVRTDHASLPWLLRTPNPAGQFARWIETLSEFTFRLLHRKGLKHSNADGLSRQVCQECKQCQRAFPSTSVYLQAIQTDSAIEVAANTNSATLAGSQALDSQIKEVYQAVKDNKPISDKELGWHAKRLNHLWDHLRLSPEGVLQVALPIRQTRSLRVVCPQDLREEVINTIHREAHFGFNKTLAIVRQKWFWPGMTSQVRRWVKCCVQCQKAKPTTQSQSSDQNKLTAGRPWQVVAVDLCGPLPETTRGNTQILVLADHFTRWYDAIPIPDGRAQTVAKVLDERVFTYFGIPEVIHTDQGAQFKSELFTACCELWQCKKTQTAPYHPQGNSIVERLNRTMGNSLRAMLADSEHLDWDDLVPQILRSIRATPHKSTGETPNYLMLGRETRLPHDLLVNYPVGMEGSEEEYAAQLQKDLQTAYTRLRETQSVSPRTDDSDEPTKFTKGDRVWLKSYFKGKGRGAKLQPKYIGPYLVTKALPYQTYEMERNGKRTIQHEGRVKLYCEATVLERTESALTATSHTEDAVTPPPPVPQLTEPETTVRPEHNTPDQPAIERPRRPAKTPVHLSNYWLNRSSINSATDNVILGQNFVLGRGSVVKCNTHPLSVEDFSLERKEQLLEITGGPEKGRWGDAEAKALREQESSAVPVDPTRQKLELVKVTWEPPPQRPLHGRASALDSVLVSTLDAGSPGYLSSLTSPSPLPLVSSG